MKKIFLFILIVTAWLRNISIAQNKIIDSLTVAIQQMLSDTSKLNALYDLSRQLVISGEYENAFKKINEMESLIIFLKGKPEFRGKKFVEKLESDKARALNLKGNIATRKADFKEALTHYHEALKISEELKDMKGIAMACNYISGVYSNLGDNENELKYLEIAIKNFESLDDKRGLWQAYYNLGSFYYLHSDYEKSLVENIKSQKYAEEINYKSGISYCLLRTGLIYNRILNYDLATDNYLKALALSNETGDKVIQSAAYSNLGVNYRQQGNFEKGFECSRKYLEIEMELKNKKNIAHAYQNIGYHFENLRTRLLNKGENEQAAAILDSALHYALLSKMMYEEAGVKQSLPGILLLCGLLSIHKKDYNNAKQFLTDAIDLAEEIGNKGIRMQAYKYFSDLYAAKNENAEALKYYRLYSNLNDSILNESNSKSINELNVRFETEKKQQQIILLQKENEIKAANEFRAKQVRNFSFAGIGALLIFGGFTYYRSKQRKQLNEKLAASLTELKQTQQQLIKTERLMEQENVRLRISRDIHDEIGSSLTKIALLSEMATEEVLSKPEETKESLVSIADYSRNVNATLGEIVWAVNPQQDTLDRLLAYMRNYIHTFLDRTGINFKINFPEVEENRYLDPDLKRNIFLVLKESLNNAVKYSKAKNIEVTFALNNGQFEMTIKDDGFGFDQGNGSLNGNGLNNMKFRMDQLGCKLDVVSSPNNGCTIFAHGKIA